MFGNQIFKGSSTVSHTIVENSCLEIVNSQEFGPINPHFLGFSAPTPPTGLDILNFDDLCITTNLHNNIDMKS